MANSKEHKTDSVSARNWQNFHLANEEILEKSGDGKEKYSAQSGKV
jgi:hypothetical protein